MAQMKHYVVNITIEEITVDDGRDDRGYQKSGVTETRSKSELARVVATRPSYPAARTFAIGLLDLLEEERAHG